MYGLWKGKSQDKYKTKYGYRLNSANRQSARSVGVDPQIDPKRQYIVQASGLRADEGIGPYDAGFYVVSVEPACIAELNRYA